VVISSYEVNLPLYEYQCPTCGRFEVIQKFSDSPLSVCPTCGKSVTKLLSAPAIQFKGAGWYVTDYAKKSAPAEGGKPESASGGEKSSKDTSSSSSSSTDKSSPSTPSSANSSASGSSPSK
jgi:putative FmdB family regulatory protein